MKPFWQGFHQLLGDVDSLTLQLFSPMDGPLLCFFFHKEMKAECLINKFHTASWTFQQSLLIQAASFVLKVSTRKKCYKASFNTVT